VNRDLKKFLKIVDSGKRGDYKTTSISQRRFARLMLILDIVDKREG
jgi:hypothetical protein